ncbi:DUF4307 domain-containing protein [Nocardioides sp.]|uniref:DUF4307 domain-containing protein n=1 Tax=Nocardioides sp. TaxID=35761 RepID=UPI002C5A373F|nr:DUF4307 domain-containing protein [Nocardioides sp.]HXH77660.1 DUF4307 domain-containing protein [Nocardioides sp.]
MTEPAAPRSLTAEDSDLAQRYAAPPPWRRQALVGAVALLAAVFVGWVAWIAWVNATPSAESNLVGFDVESDSSVVAHVAVQLEDDVVASCRVTAFAEDRTIVGEVSFTPVQGRNDVAIRTDRRAFRVELVGCSAPDQPRPR